MKKIYAATLLFGLFLLSAPVHAQMMMQKTEIMKAPTTTAIAEEEAAGKAVWDKLQNKEVSCKDLTDEDFDVLADFFMANMMGQNHAAMNTMMSDRLGEEGEEQMHIAMGKRMSGCDTDAPLPDGAGYFMPMMGMGHNTTATMDKSGRGGMMGKDDYSGGYMMSHGSFGFFGPLVGIATFIFLILGSIFFWKGISRKM